MVSGRTGRFASIVVAGTLSLAALGCNLIAGLQIPGRDKQQTENPAATEMTIKGTALFPGAQNAAEFAPIAGTKVEILDLRNGSVIQTGSADASGRFAIKISVSMKAAETVVGVRAKATRSAAYRLAAAGELEVSGLAGLVEARVDPATTVAAAKILEQAKASGSAIKVDLAKFETLVQKVKTLLTPELIASVTSGGTSGTAVLDTLIAQDATLKALAETVIVAGSSPAPGATLAPTQSPTASVTPAPAASPTPTASVAPTASPTTGATVTPTPTASPTTGATVTPTPTPSPTPTPTAIPLLANNTVTITTSSFSPSVFRVLAGTTITVNNQGGFHTLEAVDGAFSTGDMTFGDAKTLTLNQPGTYAIKCRYHGSFSGTITVE